jgi:hypothetical protein
MTAIAGSAKGAAAPSFQPSNNAAALRFAGCHLGAQRVRRAPRNNPGTDSRRAPFCASSSVAARARRDQTTLPRRSATRMAHGSVLVSEVNVVK